MLTVKARLVQADSLVVAELWRILHPGKLSSLVQDVCCALLIHASLKELSVSNCPIDAAHEGVLQA